ncbi:MAG: anthranilate synthase component I [Nitrospirales bacterium]|nr:anthranilate synthase component I [Nitrospira sp.]MDR4502904.1 anthranilate synthase component I [Nitrospirales bacterium]
MKKPYYSVSFEDFCELAQKGNLIPIYREILADYETPVSAFSKINTGPTAYLLESIEGGENWARYSFLGNHAKAVIWQDGEDVLIQEGRKAQRLPLGKNPLQHIERLLQDYRPVSVPGLPRFTGGAVGYLSYDIVRYFEPIPECPKDDARLPQLAFLLTDTLVIFDNVAHTMKVVANAHITTQTKTALRQAYSDTKKRIDEMIERLRKRVPRPKSQSRRSPLRFTSNMSREHFEKMVMRTKEYIQAGDIVQGVISQRWTTKIQSDPFEVYRALRVLNPSPYMYYLRVAGVELVGSSPEVLVRCEEDQIVVRPIAGTRPRGKTAEQDQAFADELLADTKEIAEHIMLVDLGRNDVGRVARAGTIVVDPFMTIERYSHVMHIVSQVTGRLKERQSVYDVMKACFPAGTVSGAPKIRAMQIIEELEPTRRGPYAGAVGYFSFSGNMDTCINIRTIVIKDQQAYIQAGAGIVADSDPSREYEETCSKAGAMMRGVEMAEMGLE